VRGSFRGWVMFERAAHALYEGAHGPVYWCGGVLYDLAVTIPTTEGMDMTFCPTCKTVVIETETT
jgi:hypothetical protein